MSKQEKISFNEFLKGHEFFQLALLEAVHRYYYDQCFTNGEGARPIDSLEVNEISDIHKNLVCLYPNWRYRLKKILDRYHGWETTNALHVDCKPKNILKVGFEINILANERRIFKSRPKVFEWIFFLFGLAKIHRWSKRLSFKKRSFRKNR